MKATSIASASTAGVAILFIFDIIEESPCSHANYTADSVSDVASYCVSLFPSCQRRDFKKSALSKTPTQQWTLSIDKNYL